MLKNKSHDKIDDNGAAKSKKREVNKVHANSSGVNAQFFAPPFANTKSLPFEPMNNLSYHTANIGKFIPVLKWQRQFRTINIYAEYNSDRGGGSGPGCRPRF